ncbi:hypothetical protein [Paenibacillus agaridevorans]|uniref:hypothetical protein n=1 Tax=Paenibacillus agaridevorans TaxID=171404 RepID=UPI001BE41C2F|nr:hypothetical protein [Paenibacillus agaridevorans]
MVRPNHCRNWMSVVLLGVVLLLTAACGGSVSETLVGYAVAHSEQGVLVVEPLNEDPESNRTFRAAVWVGNLHRNQVGNLLQVKLGAQADSYPGLSLSKKTKQQQQPKGERSVLIASLDYAKTKWENGLPVIDSVSFDREASKWEIDLGCLIDEEQKLRLLVDAKQEITEL